MAEDLKATSTAVGESTVWKTSPMKGTDLTLHTAGKYVDRDIVVVAPVSGTLANSAKDGKAYTDISKTDASPILVSEGSLYINEGYFENVSISLDKLLGGIDDVNLPIAATDMLAGAVAYDVNGKLVTGTIPTITVSDLTGNETDVNGQDHITVVVPSGYVGGTEEERTIDIVVKDGSASVTSEFTVSPEVSLGSTDGEAKAINAAPQTAKPADNYFIPVKVSVADTSYTAVADDKTIENGYISEASDVVVKATAKAEDVNVYIPVAAGTITMPVEENDKVEEASLKAIIPFGSQIKIGAGYYSEDAYYEAQSAISGDKATLGVESNLTGATTSGATTVVGQTDTANATIALKTYGTVNATATAKATAEGYATLGQTGTGVVSTVLTEENAFETTLPLFVGDYTVA